LTTLSLQTIEEILACEKEYSLSAMQKERIQSSFDFLNEFAKGKIIYGINTGFGPMAQYRIQDSEAALLQRNLILSHCNGAGDYLGREEARIVMICRLHTLALGFSGVSPTFVTALATFIERDIIACIPCHGGVGASGDLIQLAHMAQTILGLGHVYYKGRIRESNEVLEEEGLRPTQLQLRDGLAAINGTSCMSGISAINLILSQRLISWSIHASAIMNELTASYDDSFSLELNEAKQHIGQREVASYMRDFLHDGNVLQERTKDLFDPDQVKEEEVFSKKIQEYYSLRCAPQIIGPILDAWKYSKNILEGEINSANDNPIICVESQNVYHGGNFHGDYVAYEMDRLKLGITKLTMLMERQLNFLMNANLNQIFPPFLNRGKLGFNFGLQGMQFTAVSTTAENQTLANPMYIHSIPSNGDNQDIVSMGTNAALITKKVIHNSFEVLAAHMIAISQAIDICGNLDQMSSATRTFHEFVRQEVPPLVEDESLHKPMAKLKEKLLNTKKNLF